MLELIMGDSVIGAQITNYIFTLLMLLMSFGIYYLVRGVLLTLWSIAGEQIKLKEKKNETTRRN